MAAAAEVCREAFERVAREGRKFALGSFWHHNVLRNCHPQFSPSVIRSFSTDRDDIDQTWCVDWCLTLLAAFS